MQTLTQYLNDASVVHASGSAQLQANPHAAGPWLSPGKPTQRAITTMGSNDLVVGEDHIWDRVASGITDKVWSGVARYPLAAHLGEVKLLFQTPVVLRKYPLVEMTSGDNLEDKSRVEPLKAP